MITAGMVSSARKYWETPSWLFRELDAEFGFTLDVCADASNAKCRNFFSVERCGLESRWSGVCWMNPPYGRAIGKWVERAHGAAMSGEAERVVCLLPARTDTAWFHRNVMRASEVRFIAGRLYFGDGIGRAPFPSMVVVFGRDDRLGSPLFSSIERNRPQ